MRPAICLAALALACAASDVSAEPWRRPKRPGPLPSPPALEASSSDEIAVLRAPGPDEVLIRAGTFTMGSNDVEVAMALASCRAEPAHDACEERVFAAEQTAHEVYLGDYWIDRTEVTVARYQRCVAAGKCSLPPYATGGERFDRPDFPVTLVTWGDAHRFCTWAGARLPTEAEWERAARGLAGRRYPWGNVYNPFLANHGRFAVDDLDASDGFLELAPVASFAEGRTPDGLADLAGNAEEWVADWYADEYPRTSASNPRGPELGEVRVLRGGSYLHARAWLRGASRAADLPTNRRSWRELPLRAFRVIRVISFMATPRLRAHTHAP